MAWGEIPRPQAVASEAQVRPNTWQADRCRLCPCLTAVQPVTDK